MSRKGQRELSSFRSSHTNEHERTRECLGLGLTLYSNTIMAAPLLRAPGTPTTQQKRLRPIVIPEQTRITDPLKAM